LSFIWSRPEPHVGKKNESDAMNQVPQDQDAERLENFRGTVVTIVICYYEESARDLQDEFALDEYTLQTGFEQPLFFHLAPVPELLGRCPLEKFLRALPQHYFAFKTFNMCYGEATIGGERVGLTSSPFAESRRLTYINGTLYTGSQVRSIFLHQPWSRLKKQMMEAAPHEAFIQTRTDGWRPYDWQYEANMVLAPEEEEQAR
jgi:hypothetical protein